MATLRSNTRNNVIAGLFLLVSLLGAIAISVVLSDSGGFLHEQTMYTLRVGLDQGAGGLEAGSEVRLGGRPVGQVASLSIATDDSFDPARPVGIDIHVGVRSEIVLYENAVVIIRRPLLGTLSTLDFVSVGEPEGVAEPRGAGPRLEEGEVLPVSSGAPMLLAELGLGTGDVEMMRRMLEDSQVAVEELGSLLKVLQGYIEEDQALLLTILNDARALAEDLRERAPAWNDRIDAILVEADAAAADLNRIGDEASAAIDDARGLIADLKGVVERNSPGIDRAMENVVALSDELRTIDVDAANRSVLKITEGVDRLSTLIERVDTLFTTESPTLSRILANAALASDQLKLAAVEIRRAPWRLLYRPSERELENELLFNTAGVYSNAVGDLRTVSESLRAAAAGDPVTLEADEERIRRMIEHLNEAFERYEAAERRFLEQLLRE